MYEIKNHEKETIALIKQLQDENHFGDNEVIEAKLKEFAWFKENKPKQVKGITEGDVRHNVRASTFARAMLSAASIQRDIEQKDFIALTRRVRYDQKLYTKLFELYTGEKLPKSNKQRKLFFEQLYSQ